MKISEVRVRLLPPDQKGGEKLRAFCSVTLDDEIAIRDLRIIEGPRGLFVAMPSRKLMTRCPSCGTKNAIRSRYCNDCGRRIAADSPRSDSSPRVRRLYADVAHPIHARARDSLQRAILEAYERELEASRQEGYVPPSFDDFDDDFRLDLDETIDPRASRNRRSGFGEATSD
ncbi:MAG: septation protein SpoVG family protein [Planctomycetes bacterium]|nr:septation protein SpoVG family protein [Planctomycetota bacterium]MCB9918474.1 septation protein SpoVG family protein [Planctomycetota bacterium]